MRTQRSARPASGPSRAAAPVAAAAAILLAGLGILPVQAARQDAARNDSGAATPAAAPAAQPAAAADHREREARRLLHGAAGGVLRGRTRWVTDHWEYESHGRWEALPPAAIAEVRLESESLVESGQRRAAARRGSPADRVAVARWMLDEGLLDEGLSLLDDELDAEPDQPDAIALLASDDLPFGLPQLSAADLLPSDALPSPALEAFLAWGGRAPAALRERAAQRLARVVEDAGELPDALRVQLQQRLAGRDAGGRAFAALALRRIVPRSEASQPEVEELLRRAVLDVDAGVRRAASLALRHNDESAVILPVVAALASASAEVRSNAAESLGHMGFPAAVAPLAERLAASPSSGGGDFRPRANVFVGSQMAYVAGFDVEVANSAAIGNPEIGVLQQGVSLDVTVLGASSPGAAGETRALTSALGRLTGAHPGESRSAWLAWWATHRAEWFAGASGQ